MLVANFAQGLVAVRSIPFAIAAIITGRTLVVMMVVLAVMLVGCLASGGGHDGNDHDHVDRHFG